jgi:hypothetical protein
VEFNHLPPLFEESEDPCPDLETVIDLEIEIFVPWPEIWTEHEPFPDHYIIQDDYLQNELERHQKEEELHNLFQPKIP